MRLLASRCRHLMQRLASSLSSRQPLNSLCPRHLAEEPPARARMAAPRMDWLHCLSAVPLSDDAHVGAGSGGPSRARPPGVAYVEPMRSYRGTVLRFLTHDLGMSSTEAERAVVKGVCRAAHGVPTLSSNLRFIMDHGVCRDHIRKDFDILAIPHSELVRMHQLIVQLPGSDYRSYYPLSRVGTSRMLQLFQRLPLADSNVLEALSVILKIPVVSVCRAASGMSSHLAFFKAEKAVKNATLLMELGVPAAEILRSLYVLRVSGSKIKRRYEQCRLLDRPFRVSHLGPGETNFEKRLCSPRSLGQQSSDVEALVAARLGCDADHVRARTSARPHQLQALPADRFETVVALLEAEGYSRTEMADAVPDVYLRPPARLRQRLARCRRLGWRPPLYLLHASADRFERSFARWIGEHTAEDGAGHVGSDGREKAADGRGEVECHGRAAGGSACGGEVEMDVAGETGCRGLIAGGAGCSEGSVDEAEHRGRR